MALPIKGTGSGATVEISTDGGTQWKKLLSVTKVSMPEFTRNTVDVTDTESFKDNDQMKEFATGFIEAGDMTVEGFVRADENEGMTAAETAFYNGEPVKIRAVGPAWMQKALVYPGLVTTLKSIGDMDPENGVPYSLTFKITGKPEVTKTAGG